VAMIRDILLLRMKKMDVKEFIIQAIYKRRKWLCVQNVDWFKICWMFVGYARIVEIIFFVKKTKILV
jgi:hypothetical protein